MLSFLKEQKPVIESVTHVVAIAGVIGALLYNSWSLDEVRFDRRLRQEEFATQRKVDDERQRQEQEFASKPHVAFEHDWFTVKSREDEELGYTVIATSKNSSGEDDFTAAPRLRNFGNGPALEVKVDWKPKTIHTFSGARKPYDRKTKLEWVTIPTRIAADDTAVIVGLPEITKEMKAISGDAVVRYEDQERKEHETRFTFYIHNHLAKSELVFQFTRVPKQFDFGNWSRLHLREPAAFVLSCTQALTWQ